MTRSRPLLVLGLAAGFVFALAGGWWLAGRPDPPAPAPAAAGAPGSAGAWHVAAPLPVAIAEIAAAELGGQLFTGGGFTPPGGSVGRWFGRYLVAEDRWETRAEMPLALHHHGLAAAAGKIWLAGGYSGALAVASASRQLHAYDPRADAWERMPDMPGRRGAHGLAALDGRLFVAGGVGDAPEQMWVYDITAATWSVTSGPTPREHLGVAAAGGQLYVLGGRGHGRGIVGTAEAYDPRTDRWERLPDMPQGCGGCSAAATADGRLHITGGEGGGRTYGEHFVYDPVARAWHQAAPLPTTRHGIGAAAVGQRFYVLGGGRAQGLDYSTVVEWWAPEEVAPSPSPGAAASPSPTPPPDATATVNPAPTPAPLVMPLVGRGWWRGRG